MDPIAALVSTDLTLEAEAVDPTIACLSTDLTLEGDAFLLFSDGTQFRVSSTILASYASGVWKAMFSTRFAEGNAVLRGRPVELPDDDPEAMKALCLILHHRFDLVAAQRPCADFLENLTIVADKYDCARAMLPATTTLLNSFVKDDDFGGKLLYPFFAINDAEGFNNVTKEIVRDMNDFTFLPDPSYEFDGTMPTGGAMDLLPDGILEPLIRQHEVVRAGIMQSLRDLIPLSMRDRNFEDIVLAGPYKLSGHGTDQWSCECSNVTQYVLYLYRNFIWPAKDSGKFNLGSLLRVLQQAGRNLHVERFKTKLCPKRPAPSSTLQSLIGRLDMFNVMPSSEPMCQGCETCKIDFKKEMGRIHAAASDAIKGLCLDCIKHGRGLKARGVKCRVRHDGYLGLEGWDAVTGPEYPEIDAGRAEYFAQVVLFELRLMAPLAALRQRRRR
ncbi:hypothetical protein MMC13_004034 [Lambiella insularis]|nr:hypothetical protein [Lambiella insularis]